MGALAVELAPELPAKDHLSNRLGGLGPAGFVAFRRCQPLEPNRQPAHLDGVSVAHVGDVADERPAGTLSSRGGPGKHQETGEEAQQATVHDCLTTNVQVEDLDPSYTGATAIAIVPLPLPPAAEARALLHHLLEHGDVLGRDATGRTIIQLAVDDHTLEKLMGFDTDAAELEDGADAEPDADPEDDWLPVVLLDLARPKVIRRRRASALAFGPVE